MLTLVNQQVVNLSDKKDMQMSYFRSTLIKFVKFEMTRTSKKSKQKEEEEGDDEEESQLVTDGQLSPYSANESTDEEVKQEFLKCFKVFL